MAEPMTSEACLVPGDQVELEVRRRYGTWVAAAVEVVSELASTPRRTPWWPEEERRELDAAPRPHCGALTEGALTEEALLRARAEGWLLTGAAPGRQGDPLPDPPSDDGLLAGVAVAVKDVIDVAGLPTGNGGRTTSARGADVSAASWARLEAAGAWCVGKAATHEWAWGVTTPSIANPHDGTRIAGGSSGGSAAAVASGAATAGLGTDTGGSIRIPAALCGVVGVRPTLGSIDTTGVTPLAPEQDVVGPLALTVDAAAVVLEVLLGTPCLPRQAAVAGLRVGILARTGRLQEPVARDYELALQRLASSGVELVPLDTALPRLASAVSLTTMLTSSARLHADAVRASPHTFGSSTRALLTLGEGLVDSDRLALARACLAASTARLFAIHHLDAVVTPTTPCLAPRRDEAVIDVGGRREHVDAALTRFTAWSSATGLPAVALPAGVGRLPTSVQFMAPPHREDVCLRLARFTEQYRPEQKRGDS